MPSSPLLNLILLAYFGQLPFNQWRDAAWIWKLELMVPGGSVQFGELREYFRWPNQARIEFDFKEGKIVNFFDGEKGWEGTRTPQPIDRERFIIVIRIRNLIHELVSGNLEVVKSAEPEGRFNVRYGPGDEASVQFDTKSGYLLRYEGPSKAMGRPNISTFEWADFVVQDGVPVGQKQSLRLNGVVFQQRTLKSFKMNPGLEEKLFRNV